MKDELDVLKFRHIPRCTPIGEVSMEQDESMILQKTDEEDRYDSQAQVLENLLKLKKF